MGCCLQGNKKALGGKVSVLKTELLRNESRDIPVRLDLYKARDTLRMSPVSWVASWFFFSGY